MVRIIPWNLPEVKGGSIGGYTPHSGDADPVEPLMFYDFSGVGYVGTGYMSIKCATTTFPAGVPTTVDVTGIILNDGFGLTGIVPIDLVGVASINVKIHSEANNSAWDNVVVDDLIVSLDPLTYSMSFVSGGTCEGTSKNGLTNQTSVTFLTDLWGTTVTNLVLTFYVYNGNGEIIQETEVTVVGGE